MASPYVEVYSGANLFQSPADSGRAAAEGRERCLARFQPLDTAGAGRSGPDVSTRPTVGLSAGGKQIGTPMGSLAWAARTYMLAYTLYRQTYRSVTLTNTTLTPHPPTQPRLPLQHGCRLEPPRIRWQARRWRRRHGRRLGPGQRE